ncbi:MAG: BACON domain-containing protein, partial [Opitutales bacterium]|nr:BACON domain-containing protein [Opitutales bacterium]
PYTFSIQGTGTEPGSVSTSAASAIGTTTATLGGEVTSDGFSTITDRGVVFSALNSTPAIGGANVTQAPIGTGTGSFSQSIGSLSSGTLYYFRAYAINDAGTSYGDVLNFTTLNSVSSISRAGTTPTNASSVEWSVQFAAPLSGLTSTHFELSNSGLGGTPAVTGVSGSGTTWTVVASTGSGDGTLGLNLVNDTGLSTDLSNLTFTGEVYTINRTSPEVTSVTSSTLDGLYVEGDAISIQIGFSASVSVAGTPTLALNSGGTASYESGTGSGTLSFSYTVGSGESSADLDYSSSNALSLAGGTIRDTAGNSAVLILPVPGAANSLGANKALVIGIEPSLTTQAVSDTTTTSATGNGTIVALGIPAATEHGFVWSTSTNPTIALPTRTSQGVPSLGSFTGSITGLTPGSTYYIRAYATNSVDTSYGEERTFIATPLSLSVDPLSVSMTSGAGSSPVNVTANTAWSAVSDQPWLTLDVASGSTNAAVNFQATANTASGSRSATVTFSGTGVADQIVTVTQASAYPAGGQIPEVTPPMDDYVQASEALVKIFRIANPNPYPVNLTLSVLLSNGTWTAATLPGGSLLTLAASDEVDVPVQLTVPPTAIPGEQSAVTLIASSLDGPGAGECWLTVTVADVSIDPNPADFGTLEIGSSFTQTITFANDDLNAVTLGSVSVTGAGYSIVSDTASLETIPSGETRSIQVLFLPNAAGPHAGTVTWPLTSPAVETLTSTLSGNATHTPPPPEPDPVIETHERNEISNSERMNLWDLDPNNLLGSSPSWTIQGTLPRGLRIRDGWLTGIISGVGTFQFTITGKHGIDEVHNAFNIRVLVPTLSPVIRGVTFNGHYIPS